MSISILIYIISFILILVLAWILILEKRLRYFFLGTKAKNLEDAIEEINKQIKEVKNTQIEINKHLKIVDNRLNKTIRDVKVIRFNPFEDAGSNQSFAISLLNDKKDGVIISSLYARDRMSIFAKPINNGSSEFELSKEEKEVLDQSI
jgi:biopolymer transport protein ExbB/TolQ